MQRVIKIDEARFKDIKRIAEVQLKSNYFQSAEQIIAKGVPIEQEPCEDAISRQEVLYLVGDYDLSMGQVVKGIHALPSVNPQPKTGRWIKTIGENGITSAVRCSGCGFEDNRYMLFKYCPNCGVRMIELQERESV